MLKVLYHDKEMPKLEFIGGERSNWIDVRACKVKINGEPVEWGEDNTISYKAGDLLLIDLGFSLCMPEGYEGLLLPRSSTFKNFGLILVNSMGIVDNSYRGENDHWLFQGYALRDGKITKYDRIGQMRILKSMGDIEIQELTIDEWEFEDRGGIGKSGTR